MEENIRNISLRELFIIFKRIWIYLLITFVAGWAAYVLVDYVTFKDYYEANLYINIEVTAPPQSETLASQYYYDCYNYVYYCFDNPETEFTVVEKTTGLSAIDYEDGLSITRDSNIMKIRFKHKSERVCAETMNNIYTAGISKINNSAINIKRISLSVNKILYRLSVLVTPSLWLGLVAAVVIYLCYFAYYYLISLSSHYNMERALDMDLLGVLYAKEENKSISMNKLYANINGRISGKVIIFSDTADCSGVLSLAEAYKINGKKAVILDCSYSEECCLAGKYGGGGITSADENNYNTLIHHENGIDIIPANGLNTHNFSYLSSGKFKRLIKKLENEYDIVIINTMQINIYADALILLEIEKSSLLINVDMGKTKKAQLLKIKENIKGKKINILGAMATNIKENFYKTM